jgi:HlyD family secretion protein
MRWVLVILSLAVAGCGSACAPKQTEPTASVPIPDTPDRPAAIRLTGLVEAVKSVRVNVPAITGQNIRLTLTRLAPNGVPVQEGDVIAEFDPLEQVEAARTARAKYDDLSHQVEQKAAQNRADQEKRRSELRQAEADLRKAELELSKEPILAEIARQQNRLRAERAREHVASLQKSQASRDRAEAAAQRILELQRDRQQVALERAQSNMNVMQLRAPISGMVAHTVQYRNGSMTHAQEGDQLYRGAGLVSIFDPSEMLVRCSVGEPDRALLKEGLRATVYLDAYPDLALPAHFVSASPIATTAVGSSIKTFVAVFKLDQTDPRVVPDLSAAVVIERVRQP